MRTFMSALACAFVTSLGTLAAEEPGKQQAAHLEVQVPVAMDYLLYLPKNYEQQQSWPLVLFLHGAGERGDNLELVKVHGPPKLVAAGKDLPFVLVSPQCPKERSWEPLELIALLDAISARYRIDADRIYVTGLSMGGFGTWRLASLAPERLAAIAPICGGGETHWVRRMKSLPVWAFHGAKDAAVPVERSQAMIDALRRAGGEPKLTIYPEAEHDSWTQTYDNPEFWDWLLAQKRTGGSAANPAR